MLAPDCLCIREWHLTDGPLVSLHLPISGLIGIYNPTYKWRLGLEPIASCMLDKSSTNRTIALFNILTETKTWQHNMKHCNWRVKERPSTWELFCHTNIFLLITFIFYLYLRIKIVSTVNNLDLNDHCIP